MNTNQELMKKYNLNTQKIKQLINKINELNKQKIENKILLTILFSTFPIFVATILSLTSIPSTMPLIIYQTLITLLPLLIGSISTKIYIKKKYKNNKLNQKELEKEIINNEIEKEKLINRNKIITGILKNNTLDTNLPNEKINNLSIQLQEEKQKIDIASKEKVISQNFNNINQKKDLINNIIIYGLSSFIIMFILSNIPTINLLLKKMITPSPIKFLTIPIISSIITIPFTYKIYKEKRNIYKEYTKELKEEKIFIPEEININDSITKCINLTQKIDYLKKQSINNNKEYKYEYNKEYNINKEKGIEKGRVKVLKP